MRVRRCIADYTITTSTIEDIWCCSILYEYTDKRRLQLSRQLRAVLGMRLISKAEQSRDGRVEHIQASGWVKDIYKPSGRTDHNGLCL